MLAREVSIWFCKSMMGCLFSICLLWINIECAYLSTIVLFHCKSLLVDYCLHQMPSRVNPLE